MNSYLSRDIRIYIGRVWQRLSEQVLKLECLGLNLLINCGNSGQFA